jgi:prophage tail gpP-like protein
VASRSWSTSPAFSTADVFTFGRRIEDGAATGNILKGAESFSIKEVPSEVNVYTGGTRGDLVSNRSRSQTFNVGVETAAVNRGFLASPDARAGAPHQERPSRTLAASAKEGERVVAEAMAGFRRYEVTVQGHGQTVAGVDRLYALNTMARVRDDLCTSPTGAPLDESMLITSVTFEGGRQTGTTTTMVLVPKDSISVIPQE